MADTNKQDDWDENRTGASAHVIYYDSFEDREKAFNEAVGFLIPARYRGAGVFWRELREIFERARAGALPAYITSDPGDGLAFGSPLQVLAAARQAGGGQSGTGAFGIEAVAERFGLLPALTQPIRTLSGGETVRLALARAWMIAPYSPGLVISSPFCWMAADHLPLLEQVTSGFIQSGKPVRIQAMQGEDSRRPMYRQWVQSAGIQPVALKFETRQLRITLGVPINMLTAEPVTTRVEDLDLSLESPCLITGDNGQGKSLLAKTCAGAIAVDGHCRIGTPGRRGRARLLFQDVVGQTLLRSMDHLARSSRDTVVVDPRELNRRLADRVRHLLTGRGHLAPELPERGAPSMLAVKIMLIAVRLAVRPAALILDEPDWGLARPVAIALVLATVSAAHVMGVPVLLISHKPWWRSMVCSGLMVKKEPGDRPGERFVISVRPDFSESDR